MSPDFQYQIEAHEIHHGQETDCTSVLSRSLENHTDKPSIFLVSTPILRKNSLGVVRGLLPLFLFPQPHEAELIGNHGQGKSTNLFSKHNTDSSSATSLYVQASRIIRERSACVIDNEISVFLHTFPEESRESRTRQYGREK
ncbi:hypothetical protein TNCV_4640801 [Trichonephila clavipes]|nr:hypothetical protein TNCV_4640801 [Trichonephila clavipes]